jgi:N-acetylglucosaminyl-diphospho-decaprenol L-rhamnosyltransferase
VPPETAVVVVSRDDAVNLRPCLESVLADSPAEVVVVDNASSDGSPEMVSREFPGVTLVANWTNPGYGCAANQGFAACSAPVVLLLNSDTRIERGALDALRDHLDAHPRAAILGPRILDPDGGLQASCFPDLGSARLMLEKTPAGRWMARLPAARNRWLLSTSGHDRPRVVPWVLGAVLAIRRRAFDQVGGFDPSFFLYSEEVDLCWRLRRAGWEIRFAPVAEVVHVGGATARRLGPVSELMRIDGARLFYRRHYSRPRAAALQGMIRAAMLLRSGRRSVQALAHDGEERRRLAAEAQFWREAARGGNPAWPPPGETPGRASGKEPA